MVLFCNYKTNVITDQATKSKKATGGSRVMYAAHHPCWDAKNRFCLAPELPFDFAQIAHIFGGNPAPAASAKPAPDQQIAQAAAPSAPPKSAPETPMLPIESLDDFLPVEDAGIPENIPSALADLMRANNVTEKEIQLAVGLRGYFPENMPIANYPPDFVQGVLIGAWAQVFGMIQEIRKLPFE